MKRQEAPRIQLDSRTLWEAIRSAGGNVPMAAQSLGLTTRDLLLLLADSKITWSRKPEHAVSGARRRLDTPRPRHSDDELAWGDDGESE